MKKNTQFFRKTHGTRNNIFLIFLSTYLLTVSLYAQERKLIYDVLKNGDTIGKIVFLELNEGQQKFLSFRSTVKTSFIFSFFDNTFETSTFENGIMIHASLLQTQTGSNRTNSLLEVSGSRYKYLDGNQSKMIYAYPIYFSTLLLYIKPPANITQVYSQKFQKFLKIKKVEENKYRLIFPDGKYNDYTYNNGACSKVDIVRQLFNIEFVLKE